MLSPAELDGLLDIAHRAARAGSEVLLRMGLPRPGQQAHAKGLGDYVTDTDTASEEAIVGVLRREAPEIPVLAEERGGLRAETMWAVDPLDGTTNFIRGLPVVGLSVGLISGNRAVAGVVLGPFLGLSFSGAGGRGVYANGDRVAARASVPPAGALVATGFPFRDKRRLARYEHVLSRALERFEDLRRAGAASLDLAWVAAGTHDGFFELGLGTWDIAGGAALVLESGGLVTDWDGGDDWLASGNIVAGSPDVHAALLEATRNTD